MNDYILHYHNFKVFVHVVMQDFHPHPIKGGHGIL